ncbi:hypothetical protein Tco_0245658 [Tanacetum coccineum]
MFIKYSTGLIPPKKSRGSRRVIKKIVTIFADDNIIPKPNVSLEVGKSMSLIEAAKEKATRQVHATHERFVTESDPEPARRRPSGIAFKDTSSVSKKMSTDPSQKLKGIQTLIPKEKLAADKMQALKASRKSIRSQPHAGVSSKGIGTKPRVPDELTITPITSSEGTGTKPGVPDEEKFTSKAKADVILDWGSEQKNDDDDADDDKSIDLEKTDDEETDDEFVHSEEYVQNNDEETDDEFVHEIIDAAKADAEKTEEAKDDIKKAEFLQQAPSYLYLQDVQIQQEIPHIQSPSILTVPVFVISEPLVLTPIPETHSVAPPTTLLPPPTISSISHVLLQTTTPIPTPPITTEAPLVTTIPGPLHAIIQRVSVMEKDVQELKKVDNTTTLGALLRYEIPPAVNAYLGSSFEDALQKDKNQLPKFLPKAVSDFAIPVIQITVKKALEKTPLLLDQSSSQAQSSLKAVESLSEYELKTILFYKMDKNLEKVLRKRDRDDEDPSARPNQGTKIKRSRTKESEPSKKSSTSKESSKGKSPAKTSKSGKSVTAEEPVEEPVFEMAFDDIEQTVDDGANDADQPPDDSTQNKDKDLKKDWFKQPPRPPTPDPELKKR